MAVEASQKIALECWKSSEVSIVVAIAPTPITSVTETEGGYCGGEKYPVAAGAFCKWTFCPAPATTS